MFCFKLTERISWLIRWLHCKTGNMQNLAYTYIYVCNPLVWWLKRSIKFTINLLMCFVYVRACMREWIYVYPKKRNLSLCGPVHWIRTHARTHTFSQCTLLQDRKWHLIFLFHCIDQNFNAMRALFIHQWNFHRTYSYECISHRRNDILNKKSTDDWLIVGYDGKVISCAVDMRQCFCSTVSNRHSHNSPLAMYFGDLFYWYAQYKFINQFLIFIRTQSMWTTTKI